MRVEDTWRGGTVRVGLRKMRRTGGRRRNLLCCVTPPFTLAWLVWLVWLVCGPSPPKASWWHGLRLPVLRRVLLPPSERMSVLGCSRLFQKQTGLRICTVASRDVRHQRSPPVMLRCAPAMCTRKRRSHCDSSSSGSGSRHCLLTLC